jgi:hypothetical protein
VFILTATNVTGDGQLTRPDGTADYAIWIGINHYCIFQGHLPGHIRKAGGAELLRKIADLWDATEAHAGEKPQAT